MIIRTLQREWWAVVLRGTLAIVLGIAALIWPEATAVTIITLVAAFVLVDGAIALIAGIRASNDRGQSLGIIEGIIGLVIGLVALLAPQLALGVLAVLVGIWAIVTGTLELTSAVQLRGQLRSSWLLGLAGALSIMLGVALVVSPGAGAVLITVLVGVYGLIAGVSLVGVGIRMRTSSSTSDPQ
jgi:uncharacterized membrane protein HdeD (DUF308 family)